MVALGRSWHPEEFTCCQCKRVLDEGGFFEEKGSIYCTKCYDNRYSPNCAKCKKKITGVTAFPTVHKTNITMQFCPTALFTPESALNHSYKREELLSLRILRKKTIVNLIVTNDKNAF